MFKDARVVLVPFGASYRPAMKSEFKRVSWTVATYIPDAWLYETLRTDPVAAVVISGPWQQTHTVIVPVRATLPSSMVVVVLDDEGTKDTRIDAMNLGADVCFSAYDNVSELVAFAGAGFRRIGSPQQSAKAVEREPVQDAWRLNEIGRQWLGPKGEVLPLTSTELEFLRRLLSAPGRRLSRNQFLPSDSQKSAAGPNDVCRRIDVLVSRLRNKAESLGITVPVLAIRQWGYMFLDERDLS